MKKSSVTLVTLVVFGLMAIASPALYAHSLMQHTAENTALDKMGQIEDNITKPLNRGEEHVNISITMVENSISPPKYTIVSMVL